jgi:DNA replication protein DnaC
MDSKSDHLLKYNLKALKLPTFLRDFEKMAREGTETKATFQEYLLKLTERELNERQTRATERRIHQARFPTRKTLDSYDFKAMPSLNKHKVLQMARCEFIGRRENIIAVGNSGTGKTHLATAIGMAACQEGYRVRFYTAAGLVTELLEARDMRSLGRLQKKLAHQQLVIVDEVGYVPFSKSGAELLFEFFSQRYERGSVLVTSNLPFEEWTEVFGNERLTAALLDRLTHRVQILEMNGESYRFRESLQNGQHFEDDQNESAA